MLGLLISLTIQAFVLAVQLTVWLVRLLVIATVFLWTTAARALETHARHGQLPAGYRRRRLDPAMRWGVFARDGYSCVRCASRFDLTVDHIKPVSAGGSDDPDNLQTLCRPCNCSKGPRY